MCTQAPRWCLLMAPCFLLPGWRNNHSQIKDLESVAKGRKMASLLLSPTRLFHGVQTSALAIRPYTDVPRTPGCPAWFSPLCRPGSPAHTRTGGGGSPVPGPASRTAGHLRCTSCTRRPLPTGTAKRRGLSQHGSTGVGSGRTMQRPPETLEGSLRTSGNLQRPLQWCRFFFNFTNTNST